MGAVYGLAQSSASSVVVPPESFLFSVWWRWEEGQKLWRFEDWSREKRRGCRGRLESGVRVWGAGAGERPGTEPDSISLPNKRKLQSLPGRLLPAPPTRPNTIGSISSGLGCRWKGRGRSAHPLRGPILGTKSGGIPPRKLTF